MLVESSRFEEAIKQAKVEAEATRVGPTSNDSDHIGPLANELQFNKVQGLIKSGIDDGASLLAGGLGRPEGLSCGYYVRPTVFANVTSNMAVFKEEIFGPVLTMLPFDSEEQAITLANDTAYGLTNYVQTEDLDKVRRVSRRLRSGMVENNGERFAPGSPFGGYKQSGNGREGGAFGIEEFLEVKAVSGWAQ